MERIRSALAAEGQNGRGKAVAKRRDSGELPAVKNLFRDSVVRDRGYLVNQGKDQSPALVKLGVDVTCFQVVGIGGNNPAGPKKVQSLGASVAIVRPGKRN